MQKDKLRFLTPEIIQQLTAQYRTPLFIYSKHELKRAANDILKACRQLPYGATVRYAMKANPHPEILHFFTETGLHIDASSSYEAEQALAAQVPGQNILLTSQQLPPTDERFRALIAEGVKFTATSLHQLREYCRLFPRTEVSVRINPGMGSGMNNRLTTGGVNASFGIWYEYIPEVLEITQNAGVKITRLHTHIGTGTDPAEWEAALDINLHLVEKLPDVTTLDIGGGFKSAYMPGEHDANMQVIMKVLATRLEEFAQRTGRQLHLEVEPGRWLVVHAGTLLTKVVDRTDTGINGHQFARVDTGMTDILRPAMYGAQHPLVTVPMNSEPRQEGEYVIAGHCCESSDVLTTAKGNPEELEPRHMVEPQIGDIIAVECVGAYCANMRASMYNSYPPAEEVVID